MTTSHVPTSLTSAARALLALLLVLAPCAAQLDLTGTAEKHVAAARERTLALCKERGLELPTDFMAWVDGDAVVRATVYGVRKDPLPVLLGLRSLELDLGVQTVRKDYTQLALAFALQGSYGNAKTTASTWNDGDATDAKNALPDIRPRAPLQLTIPSDPRKAVNTKDTARPLDRDDHIINFLEDHAPVEIEVPTKQLPPLEYDEKGVAKPQGKPLTVMVKQSRAMVAADVLAATALQTEFNTYMAAHGHPTVVVDCGERVVHWKSTAAVSEPQRTKIKKAFDLFHDAYRNKGRMPVARDRAPTAAESMAWFIRNDRHAFSEADKAARKWPHFPLSAPWPVLMMLADDDQPLREREEIWAKFRDSGEFRTYGEYIGDIAQQGDMQSARRVSPLAFNYGSIQMMWKDGGVCGTMGNIGARTHRICGTPASTAGQPGHCALVVMGWDAKTGHYNCHGEQYATGGDEVTHVHAGWNYGEAAGRKPMLWHQSVAWGVNHGLASFVDTLALRGAYDALPQEKRTRYATALAEQGLARNPFALGLLEAAIANIVDAAELTTLLDKFNTLALAGAPEQYVLYRSTVRDLVHARIAALPAPATKEQCSALLRGLERQHCANAALLARCWRSIDCEAGFDTRCRNALGLYIIAPARTANRKEGDRMARWIADLGKTVTGKRRKEWAVAMLQPFAGREAIVIRGKKRADPVVAALCKLADRPVPAL